jgi:hypothetical protein
MIELFFKQCKEGLGVVVAHTCNLSYLGGRVQEDCGLSQLRGKKLVRSHLNNNNKKLGLVVCICNPYAGGISRRITL